MKFGETYGSACGARFLYYFRQKRDMPAVIRLLNDSPHFVGVKIGTGEEDVEPLVEGVGNSGIVMWGIGDRCTASRTIRNEGTLPPVSQSLSLAPPTRLTTRNAEVIMKPQRVLKPISRRLKRSDS